ncbi:transposase [Rhizobium mongolense]
MNTSIRRKIEEISQNEANCRRLMSVPGVGPLISRAMVAAFGTGEAFERGRASVPGLASCRASTVPAADRFWEIKRPP